MQNGNRYDPDSGDAMDWAAFMAGALIGAGIALLFSPERGTELRSKLRDYANRAKDDLLEKGHEALDTMMERGKEYYDKGEQVVRDAGRSAQDFAKQTQDMAREPGRSAL
jgi:gas vesicle protein